MKKSFFFLLLLASTACRETVISTADINIPVKLVVGCFISPQTDTLTASVTLSKPLYTRTNTDTFENVTNANVQITDGSQTAVFSYDSNRALYFLPSSQFDIAPGLTYSLVVTTPDGKRATATCTVPTAKNLNFSLTASEAPNSVDEWGNYGQVEARWTAPGDVERFYRFNYALVTELTNTTEVSWQNTAPFYNTQFLRDSESTNGLFRFRETFYLGFQDPWSSSTQRVEGLLQELDRNSYFYFSSLANQLNTAGGFGEPTVIYTNVEGGLGCFGAHYEYRLLSDTL